MQNAQPFLIPMPRISGEYTEDARIVLHLGDSFEFLRTIPSGIATLIITSPPYNIGKEYEVKKSL